MQTPQRRAQMIATLALIADDPGVTTGTRKRAEMLLRNMKAIQRAAGQAFAAGGGGLK